MNKNRAILAWTLTASMAISLFTGCGAQEKPQVQEPDPKPAEESVEAASLPLEGHTLHIYCGAGMKAPFEEIAEAFEAETGCVMEVSYANAAQIQTQINTAQEGDFFIAGSPVEVKPVEAFAESSTPLVKHIPVIAVQKGNPKSISGPADLGNSDLRVVIGDPESTPIGKIANKIFADFDLKGKVNIISNTTTAPAMSNVLAADECDAIIVWKENVNLESAEVIESAEMEAYIKNIPAVRLTCSADSEAADSFLDYLNSTTSESIWLAHGYELA